MLFRLTILVGFLEFEMREHKIARNFKKLKIEMWQIYRTLSLGIRVRQTCPNGGCQGGQDSHCIEDGRLLYQAMVLLKLDDVKRKGSSRSSVRKRTT